MSDQNKPPISEVLLELIENSDRPLKAIAAAASVDYQALRRWVRGEIGTYNADAAEAVYRELTGKGFTDV